MEGDADIDKAENEPLRHPAVKAARREEGKGKQGKQQNHDGRGPRLDLLLSNAEPDNSGNENQAQGQDHNIQHTPAHGQGKDQRHHTDRRGNAEHTLTQADLVVKDDIKPFSNHAKSRSFSHGSYIPPICPHSPSYASRRAAWLARINSTSPRVPASSSSFAWAERASAPMVRAVLLRAWTLMA